MSDDVKQRSTSQGTVHTVLETDESGHPKLVSALAPNSTAALEGLQQALRELGYEVELTEDDLVPTDLDDELLARFGAEHGHHLYLLDLADDD